MDTRVSSAATEVVVGDGRPTVLIGERINPTGRRALAEALKAGDLEMVRREALAQAQAGADMLDVNVSAFGVDEVRLLPDAVSLLTNVVDLPLCLDTANPVALAQALNAYRGKPLVNSVTGEEKSLATVLPLVKNYGAAVIGLVQDEAGMPANAEQRLAIAHRIVERAEAMGIPREDILIDCMALAVGADPGSGLAVLEAVRRVRAELGVNVLVAASNVSFGMPDRQLLNSAFLSAAICAGATCLIADVARVRPAVLAADLISGRDRRARRYIEAYRQRQTSPTRAT
ncbi:MAG: dihydropteroate synthase [Chloroflexi bacterium]|nr:dihydropteroate synthase [Chloroflexota bacterium]